MKRTLVILAALALVPTAAASAQEVGPALLDRALEAPVVNASRVPSTTTRSRPATGRLWLFFDQSLGTFDGRCGEWYTRCDNSDDAEPVWSRPVRFADGGTLNKPTVLREGDWLLPVSLWTRDRISTALLKDAQHELDAVRMANVFASTDQGKTWTRRLGVSRDPVR